MALPSNFPSLSQFPVGDIKPQILGGRVGWGVDTELWMLGASSLWWISSWFPDPGCNFVHRRRPQLPKLS